MIRSYILIIVICTSFSLTLAQVSNTSFINDGGEKVLQLSIVLPIEKSETWNLFTTDSGLVKWIAPVAKINLKTGGWIKTNYNPQKTLDDSTAIKLDIINFLKEELLTLKVNLNDNFPRQAKQEDKNLQEVLQFIDLGNGHTKIISSMVGFGQGEHWDKTYAFFEKGNVWTFQQILNLFNKDH